MPRKRPQVLGADLKCSESSCGLAGGPPHAVQLPGGESATGHSRHSRHPGVPGLPQERTFGQVVLSLNGQAVVSRGYCTLVKASEPKPGKRGPYKKRIARLNRSYLCPTNLSSPR